LKGWLLTVELSISFNVALDLAEIVQTDTEAG